MHLRTSFSIGVGVGMVAGVQVDLSGSSLVKISLLLLARGSGRLMKPLATEFRFGGMMLNESCL